MSWTSSSDVRKYVRRLWDRGRLLAEAEALFPLRVPLKGPRSEELASRFPEVQEWIARLRSPAYRLEMRTVRHRVIGRNEVPARIWLDSFEQAVALIGKARDARRFEAQAKMTRERCPALLPWLFRRPLRGLELAESWSWILDVVTWLQAHPRPGVYIRQVDFPGVHTKFIEQHRAVLTELLELALPPEAIDFSADTFERRFGFREKSTRVRFRLLDRVQGLPEELTDLSLLRDEFAAFEPRVRRIFITENEVNMLSFPRVPDSLVVFGSGYLVETMDRAAWLRDRPIFYWGDIDTHGFAILDRLREHFPQARSFLMDRATLLAHRESWVTEKKPVVRELARLRGEERELYEELVTDRHARALRLEQEFIRFSWVHRALAGLIETSDNSEAG